MTQVEFPRITSVASGAERPFWSVMIPTYKREKYLERTLRSVLEQVDEDGQPFGEGEMQIEVVDNASPNSEEIHALVREVGGGRVGFFTQKHNQPIAENWNTCVRRSRGHWVHILHDDDIVQPGFYARYRRFIKEHSEVGMIFSRPVIIDEEDRWKSILVTPLPLHKTGVWEDAAFGLLTEHTSNFLRCPSIVIARRAYEKVGGYDPISFYSTDWQLYIRVASAFQVGYIDELLALYREYSSSVTYTLMRDRDLIPDIERNIAIGMTLLPPERHEEARRLTWGICGHLSGIYRYHMNAAGYARAELRYSRHLFRYSPTFTSTVFLLKSLARALKAQVHKPSPGRGGA